MPSSLSWLDFDHAARERSQALLAFFNEPGTRDELGIGNIRDALADQLFPGTSTIQTRLRYMLLVPWVYQQLEADRVPAARFPERARQLEIELIGALIANGSSEDESDRSIIGAASRASLQRLPSSVYWAGLGHWGIRQFAGSQNDYHQAINQIYAARHAVGRKDDGELDGLITTTWHPKLPKRSSRFPGKESLRLTLQEAEFLRDQVLQTHRGSYLAWLMGLAIPDDSAFPWEYTRAADLPAEIAYTVRHARLFSRLMHGASLLYNLLLARQMGRDDWVGAHSESLARWQEATNWSELADWNLDQFFDLVAISGYRIHAGAQTFVRQWRDTACESRKDIAQDADATALVRNREISLKKSLSRFTNPSALARWSGSSGGSALEYRWTTVRQYLWDLRQGLDSEP